MIFILYPELTYCSKNIQSISVHRDESHFANVRKHNLSLKYFRSQDHLYLNAEVKNTSNKFYRLKLIEVRFLFPGMLLLTSAYRSSKWPCPVKRKNISMFYLEVHHYHKFRGNQLDTDLL